MITMSWPSWQRLRGSRHTSSLTGSGICSMRRRITEQHRLVLWSSEDHRTNDTRLMASDRAGRFAASPQRRGPCKGSRVSSVRERVASKSIHRHSTAKNAVYTPYSVAFYDLPATWCSSRCECFSCRRA
jgi:hypothetical protein